MLLDSKLNNPIYYQKNFEDRCQSPCGLNEKDKTNSNKFNTQFVKISQKYNIEKAYGHSKLSNKYFSRRNSVATTDSSSLSTQVAAENKKINKCYNRCMHSQQSWSMSHSKNKNKNRNRNNNFTEPRSNYERMRQQLQHRQLWPWASEQVIRCKVSNSRAPTCSVDKNLNEQDTKATKFCDAIYSEFVALSMFRLENSKYCFSDRHHHLLDLRTQTPSNFITNPYKKAATTLQKPLCEFNGCLTDIDDDKKNISRSLASSLSSLSIASVTPVPYAWRQRILREQLAKETAHEKSSILCSDKSVALSHLAKY